MSTKSTQCSRQRERWTYKKIFKKMLFKRQTPPGGSLVSNRVQSYLASWENTFFRSKYTVFYIFFSKEVCTLTSKRHSYTSAAPTPPPSDVMVNIYQRVVSYWSRWKMSHFDKLTPISVKVKYTASDSYLSPRETART